ncbi:hypothetical protein RHGRI_011417 [Rhododendron griersonianum]|uniref:Uncharacterized protein n=1 Tax=Rhododendron griersonianum TaxID=479676 RepID=A0AAV6KMQ4_9ERIC|nr:hypothetical protein RHGRI_011417 [Rhododendron griersonianum]
MLQQKENIEPDTPQQVEDEEEQTEKVEMETPLVPTRTVQTVDCPEDEPDEQDMGTEVEAPTREILQPQESIAASRPKRDIRIPARYTDMVAYALPVTDDDVPETYREAAQSAYSAVDTPI